MENNDLLQRHPDYRLGVGIMVLNRHNQIFVATRTSTRLPQDWQMPQGGVENDEDLWQAARRELYEETSITDVEYLDTIPHLLSYDIPQEIVSQLWGGKYIGQQQKWFVVRFVGPDQQVNLDSTHPEFSYWKWQHPEELVAGVNYFMQDLYRNILQEFAYLWTGQAYDRKNQSRSI